MLRPSWFRSRLRRLLAGLMLLMTIPLACAQPAPPLATPAPTPTATPDPASILREAGAAMAALESVRWSLTREGGPAYLDAGSTLNLASASGVYVAPDAVQATLAVQGPGINLELETIAVGADQWVTNPLTRVWEKLPPSWGYNPAKLFDPNDGLEALLRDDVRTSRLVGIGDLDGKPAYQIEATIAADRTPALTGGLVRGEALTATIWIEPVGRRVLQLSFASGDPATPALWTLAFFDFDAPLTVTPPGG